VTGDAILYDRIQLNTANLVTGTNSGIFIETQVIFKRVSINNLNCSSFEQDEVSYTNFRINGWHIVSPSIPRPALKNMRLFVYVIIDLQQLNTIHFATHPIFYEPEARLTSFIHSSH